MNGGIVVVRDGKVAAQLAYPVAGMLSLDPPAEVGRAHQRIVEAAGEICAWLPPYRTFKALSGQSLACNPGPHLTDLGLTDGTTQEIRPGLVRML
jgi:adenine deaminase